MRSGEKIRNYIHIVSLDGYFRLSEDIGKKTKKGKKPVDTYQMDWDFFNQVQHDDALAVVTAYISGLDAWGIANNFMESLEEDSNGIRGRGGWAIYDVTDEVFPDEIQGDNAALRLVSGGQDVATSIEDGAWEISRFADENELEIEWETEAG